MKVAKKVGALLVLFGVSAIAAIEIGHYRARANVLAAVAGFNGARAFDDLRHLVDLGPRPPRFTGARARTRIHLPAATRSRCGNLG
jgi:hypothetical protein